MEERIMRIRDELVLMGDEKYRAFMIPLIPSDRKSVV